MSDVQTVVSQYYVDVCRQRCSSVYVVYFYLVSIGLVIVSGLTNEEELVLF